MSETKGMFEAVAKAIRDNTSATFRCHPDDEGGSHVGVYKDLLINDLCSYFKGESEGFDEERFREACLVK